MKRGDIYRVSSKRDVIIISNNVVNKHSSNVIVLPIYNDVISTSSTIHIEKHSLIEKVGEVTEQSMEDIDNGLFNIHVKGQKAETIFIKSKNQLKV